MSSDAAAHCCPTLGRALPGLLRAACAKQPASVAIESTEEVFATAQALGAELAVPS